MRQSKNNPRPLTEFQVVVHELSIIKAYSAPKIKTGDKTGGIETPFLFFAQNSHNTCQSFRHKKAGVTQPWLLSYYTRFPV